MRLEEVAVVQLLRQAVPAAALVVAVDPGKVSNRVWLTSGERGLIGAPVSLPVLREGVDTLAGLIAASGVAGAPTIAVEATGRLHQAWVAELERRWPARAAWVSEGANSRTDPRTLAVEDPTGQAVLACAAAFAGRAPTVRSLRARAPGRLLGPPPGSGSTAGGSCCPHPTTPSCEPSGWVVILPATSSSKPTSPRSKGRSLGCWPPLLARS